MKTIKLLVIASLLITWTGIFCAVSAAVIPPRIFDSMKIGNAAELAKYFNSSVELVILDKEEIYSRQHAEQVVRNFFTNNKPKNFTILHQGGRDGAKYAIGKLETENKSFRIYFLVKDDGGKPLIHQLRIEEE